MTRRLGSHRMAATRLLPVLAMLAWLVGCTPPATPAADVAPITDTAAATSSGPVTPADPASPPPGTSAMRCDASKAQSAIGKTATQDVIDQAVAASTSGAVRVIKPGQAVTADFSESRLNLEVDAGNVITRVSCG